MQAKLSSVTLSAKEVTVMRWYELLIGTLLLAFLALCIPVFGQGDEMIAYQPDILGVNRLFMIVLKVPTDAPQIKVTVPDEVEMLDRTPLPTKQDMRKYYFRSLTPARQTDIVFDHPAGEITISIEIWSFEDLRRFRELKGVQLPRRWPLGEELPELKQAQTITPDALKEYMKGRGAPGKNWLNYTDEEIWSVQPDSTIRRTGWVNLEKGCPVHGREIYRIRAYYPWHKGTPIPATWKVRCPIGDEEYPSNDLAHDDFTSGEFPDDGITSGCILKGEAYHFVAELCREYCRKALTIAPACADGYLATGDIKFVHKALVILCRLAEEYSYLATMTHHRYIGEIWANERFVGPRRFADGPFLAGSGFTEYHIAQPGPQWRNAEAYDKIFPAIDQDEEIIPFLQSKGFDVKTHEDVRRFIEDNLFAVWMQGAMDGATSSNEPYAQRGLARMAECLNYKRGDEFMDWLYDHPRGKMRYFVTNTFFRDGAPYESTGGYNGMHVTAIGPIVESIEHLREMRPEVYPDDKYPNLSKSRRYHSIFDFSMNTVNIDRTYPKVGDGGSYPRYGKRGKIRWQNGGVAAFEHAYKIFKDPKFAWALANHTGWQPSMEFPYTREQIEAAAAQWPDDFNDPSCLQDGYGLAMLRSGEGDNKRALWMMYGRARGHTHDDIMQIGLDGYQSEILGHMGYPRNWGYWEHCWMTQILARQFPYVQMTATSQLFADAGPVHVCEALAHGFSDKVSSGEGYQVSDDNWQRRMLAIVDVSDDQFYCVDLYRIHGGEEHWWSFHAQEGDFTTGGIDLTRQEGGTVAGPEVPYGDPEWLKANGCSLHSTYGWRGLMFGFAHLYNVQRGKSEGPWWADWALENADGLHFRMTVPQAEGMEAIVADGTSPAGGDPYEMKWILLHKQAEAPTRTQVMNVMELYNGAPVIKSVRPLEVSGGDEAGFEAYGCVVELTNGRTDTIFAAADPDTAHTAAGGFGFAGRFGLHSEQDGVTTSLVLVGGTRLTKNGIGITQETGEYRGGITKVNRETETITVSPAPQNPAAMVGNYIYITNPVRRIAYKVLEAKEVADGAELRLEFDSRIGTGKATGIDGPKVLTPTPFHLSRYRYYHGARIVNADGTAEYQLAGVQSARFALIDAGVHPDLDAATLETEFPADTWFDIYDYGVGDEVVWPQTVSVTEVGPAAYEVTATDKFTLSLPKNVKAGLASH